VNLSKKREEDSKVELQIAPLIDVVFLLLIYFLVTASLIKKEADISFILPVPNPNPQPVDLPVEALIMITADGTVELDGLQFPPADMMLNELVTQLDGLREIAATQTTMPLVVTITPNRETLHLRIVDVMDACAAAKVTALSFGKTM
jgi:biopolymer transport protein ExbD